MELRTNVGRATIFTRVLDSRKPDVDFETTGEVDCMACIAERMCAE
jgi:hypothetical protein